MAERPTPVELLEVLADFLRSLQSEADGEVRYKLLVAAHACGIVAREVELGPQHVEEDLALLRELLGVEAGRGAATDHRAEVEELTGRLAGAIREGAFDDRLEWLGRQLLPLTLRKLAVARPGYAEA